MNEPKRWSSSGSDVDPVLRSVLRYARDLQPNPAELSAVVQGTVARQRRTPGPLSRRRGKTWGLVALVATFTAGAALASYGNRLWFASTAPATPASVAPANASPPFASVGAGVARAPRSEPSVASSASVAPPPVRSTPIAIVSATPTFDSSQDARLLHEARGLVAANPARALTLTRDHELHFPNSALNEERHALRIEALARLGRHAEAARELVAFDQRFPLSIYSRRLHALPVP